jgi:hypothetical protein
MAGLPLPVLAISGLPAGVSGAWGLWEIAAQDADETRSLMGLPTSVLLPLFRHDDGRVLDPTARWIWDAMLRPSTAIVPREPLRGAVAEEVYREQEAVVRRRGGGLYADLVAQLRDRIAAERAHGEEAYAARRTALERIGLVNMRRARLAELAAEETAWRATLERRAQFQPALRGLILLRVVSL